MAAPAPGHIIIIGAGVFGLSTAWALSQHPDFATSAITLLDRGSDPEDGSAPPDASSIDASRIIRADYPHACYSRLVAQAQESHWRQEWGAEGRYTECGLAIFSDGAGDEGEPDMEVKAEAEAYMEGAMQNVTVGLGLRVGKKEDGGQATLIDGEQAAQEVMGTTGGRLGTKGYVNWTSGWAHAEQGVRYLQRKVSTLR